MFSNFVLGSLNTGPSLDGLPAHSKQARADHSTAPNGASLRLAITVWLMPPVHMNLVSQYDNSGVEFVS